MDAGPLPGAVLAKDRRAVRPVPAQGLPQPACRAARPRSRFLSDRTLELYRSVVGSAKFPPVPTFGPESVIS